MSEIDWIEDLTETDIACEVAKCSDTAKVRVKIGSTYYDVCLDHSDRDFIHDLHSDVCRALHEDHQESVWKEDYYDRRTKP